VYKREALNAFVAELIKHEKIQKVSIYQGSVWANPDPLEPEHEFEITGELADKFRNLIEELEIPIHWRIDDGVLVYLTSAMKFEKHFNLAFIYRKLGSSERTCDLSLLEEEAGECEIILNENWALNYTWTPQI
jgi:hypothetical protein